MKLILFLISLICITVCITIRGFEQHNSEYCSYSTWKGRLPRRRGEARGVGTRGGRQRPGQSADSRQQYALDVTPRRAVSCRLESWACGLLRKNVSQSGLPWRRLSLQQWYVHTKHSLSSMSHVILNYRPLTSNRSPPHLVRLFLLSLHTLFQNTASSNLQQPVQD